MAKTRVARAGCQAVRAEADSKGRRLVLKSNPTDLHVLDHGARNPTGMPRKQRRPLRRQFLAENAPGLAFIAQILNEKAHAEVCDGHVPRGGHVPENRPCTRSTSGRSMAGFGVSLPNPQRTERDARPGFDDEHLRPARARRGDTSLLRRALRCPTAPSGWEDPRRHERTSCLPRIRGSQVRARIA